jgi:hypothetical protein
MFRPTTQTSKAEITSLKEPKSEEINTDFFSPCINASTVNIMGEGML